MSSARDPLADLDPDWLRCAAYLGHAPARERLGDAAPPLPEDLRDWILGFDAWGDEIAVRALLALADLRREHGQDLPRHGVLTAQALIACPCQEHERKARIAWSQDAPWSGDFDWAELAAEMAWDTGWKTTPAQVQTAVREGLVPWALAQGAGLADS